MPAFSEKKFAILSLTLTGLFQRTLEVNPQPEISYQELYEAMVRKEHRAVLKQTEELVGVIQTHTGVEMPVALNQENGALFPCVRFDFKSPMHHILPDYRRKGFCKDASDEVVMKVTDWLRVRKAIGWDFTKTMLVMEDLNNMTSSPKQMRFFFDGIVGLCELSDDPALKKIADTIREPEVPTSFTSLNLMFRQACKDATQTIAKALLIDKYQKAVTHDVVLSVEIGKIGAAQVPWIMHKRVKQIL